MVASYWVVAAGLARKAAEYTVAVLKLECTMESPGGLLGSRLPGPTLEVLSSVESENLSSLKLPGDAETASPGATL